MSPESELVMYTHPPHINVRRNPQLATKPGKEVEGARASKKLSKTTANRGPAVTAIAI